MKKVTRDIFYFWKAYNNNFHDYIGTTYAISLRTFQKIKSVDTYEEYTKKYCNKKPVNPIQKTYVNLIKKIENVTKKVEKTIKADHEISLIYLDNFQKDSLKTRSLISKLIILDIAITTIGAAFLIALICF